MASSNPLKDQILTLFPDNNTKEISASDMRIFVNTIFNSKEELVTKVETKEDIKDNNSTIFWNSVVIIWNSLEDNGVYLSKANNPISILQLEKIADISSENPHSLSDLGDFMVDFLHAKSYSDAEYFYQNGDITKTELTQETVRTYDINYTYTTGDITLSSITELLTGNIVHISFGYDGGNISTKTYVIVI